jgi:hypothetical protein
VKPYLAIALLLTCPLAMADNYATCILDKMPGVQNDNAVAAARSLCLERFTGGFEAVEQGSGRGFFGYDSGAECALEESRDTRNNAAAYQIRTACNKLYDKKCSSLAVEFGLSCQAD